MPQTPDDTATRQLDPAEIIGASRGAWRRACVEAVCETARLLASKETSTAERVRLAALIETMARALDVIV